jgi:hypothetical protein
MQGVEGGPARGLLYDLILLRLRVQSVDHESSANALRSIDIIVLTGSPMAVPKLPDNAIIVL